MSLERMLSYAASSIVADKKIATSDKRWPLFL